MLDYDVAMETPFDGNQLRRIHEADSYEMFLGVADDVRAVLYAIDKDHLLELGGIDGFFSNHLKAEEDIKKLAVSIRQQFVDLSQNTRKRNNVRSIHLLVRDRIKTEGLAEVNVAVVPVDKKGEQLLADGEKQPGEVVASLVAGRRSRKPRWDHVMVTKMGALLSYINPIHGLRMGTFAAGSTIPDSVMARDFLPQPRDLVVITKSALVRPIAVIHEERHAEHCIPVWNRDELRPAPSDYREGRRNSADALFFQRRFDFSWAEELLRRTSTAGTKDA